MKYKIFLIAILAFLFASCNSNHDIEKHDEHEETKIQFTAYSNEFELFAEADPFVTGRSSNVLSHFSHLPDFKAVESGSIIIRLIVGNKETTQLLEKPTRKGIYSFDIKPETTGNGQIVFDIKTDVGIFQLIVPQITVYSNEEEAHEADEALIISKTNTTVFTKEQSWKIDFATELPKTEPFGQVIKTTAQIQSSQGEEIIVSAKTSGIVILNDNGLLEGKSVSKGQTLFLISGNAMADNNSAVRFAEAKNNYETTKAGYERQNELAKDKIISQKDLLKAKNDFDNAKAIYDNLNENFSANGQAVSSSISGYVKQIFVANGQYVVAGHPIITISQNRTLMLHADVQQKYASLLGSIVSANIRSLHDNHTYTLEQLNGKVLSFGKSANNDNYLIPVNLQIDNKVNFVSGGFVELYLKTLTSSNALTVPNSALLEEQGNFFVFIQITPELFEKREVKIASTDGVKTEIVKGINQNERVVTKGAILVKLAQSTGALDPHSGHAH